MKRLFFLTTLAGSACQADLESVGPEAGAEGVSDEVRPLGALDHCDYVQAHAEDFTAQLREVADGAFADPLLNGGEASIVQGPQGGYHVELRLDTTCWYNPELLQEYLHDQDLGTLDPSVNGVNLSVDLGMVDGQGTAMFSAGLGLALREQAEGVLPMFAGTQLWIISDNYLRAETDDGLPLSEYVGVTFTVEASDPICNVVFPAVIFEEVTLKYEQL